MRVQIVWVYNDIPSQADPGALGKTVKPSSHSYPSVELRVEETER